MEEELEKTERRRYNILRRERAIDEAQKKKNRSAIVAGLCILGTATAVYFSGQDPHQVIQNEMNAIYSWDAFVQYFKDIGPLTTLLTAASASFVAKYLKDSRRFKDAQHEFEDFNASLNVELGGEENAKSR